MKIILIIFFFYVFWKGLERDNGWLFWIGLIMMVAMLMWQLFDNWIFLSGFF